MSLLGPLLGWSETKKIKSSLMGPVRRWSEKKVPYWDLSDVGVKKEVPYWDL